MPVLCSSAVGASLKISRRLPCEDLVKELVFVNCICVMLFAPQSDFSLNIPYCLFQVLDRVVLQVAPPNVFERVAEVEGHVLGNLDALDA